MIVGRLLNGIVVESRISSRTGQYLYSGHAVDGDGNITQNTFLNNLAYVPVLGILAGVARIALGIIHVLGHLVAALFTLNGKGHLYHAAKGGCEIIRGLIEALPIIGNIVSCIHGGCGQSDRSSWWMIKMYNPDHPDGVDRSTGCYVDFKRMYPGSYFRAEPEGEA